MTVEVTPLNVLGGGSPPLTAFSDNFNRTDGPLGINWAYGIYGVPTPITAPIGGPFPQIISSGFTWLYNGSNNPLTNWACYATPIIDGLYRNLYGRTQFCQATFRARSGPSSNSGLAVALSAEHATFYVVGSNFVPGPAESVSCAQVVAAGGTPYQFALSGLGAAIRPASGFAAGEVVRISVDQSGANPIVTVKINGVQVFQATDASATKISKVGSPGMVSGYFPDQFTQTGNVTWDDFSCGLGL